MTRILAKVTRALAHAHQQRIAHRDIKPANILLDSQGTDGVYLCDFGLGRDLAIATTEQMRDGAGTPMYMAPERLLRVPADEIRCDIYSMGVTLFEALTLERPLDVPEHVTLPSLPAYLAMAQPRRPREVWPGFSEEHEAIIQKAMAQPRRSPRVGGPTRRGPRSGRQPLGVPPGPYAHRRTALAARSTSACRRGPDTSLGHALVARGHRYPKASTHSGAWHLYER